MLTVVPGLPIDPGQFNAAVAQAQAELKAGDALSCLRRLEPLVQQHAGSVPAWNTLGEARVAQEMWSSAEDAFWRVVSLAPNTWPCWYNLLLCASRSRADKAVAKARFHVLDAVVTAADIPTDEKGDVIRRAAQLLNDYGPAEVAETAAQRWHALGGGTDALALLGQSLNQQNRYGEALPVWQEILQSRPDDAIALASVGVSLAGCDRYPEAVSHYRQAISINPRMSQVMHNLMYALQFCGDLEEEGLGLLNKSIELSPEQPHPYMARAVVHLRAGRYRQGFSDYEYRLQTYAPGSLHYRHTLGLRDQGVPLWKGESLQDKRIFVHPEQGHGDFIMCVRLLPLLKRFSPAEIGFFSVPNLERYAHALPLDGARFMKEVPRGWADCYVPLLSLMHRLELAREADVPPPVAPVIDDATASTWRRWREGARRSEERLVGVTWRGSSLHPVDRYRTVGFETFVDAAIRPLLARGDVRMVSLQKDMTSEECAELAALGVEVEAIGMCADWYESAALVRNLDIVLGVDTALIHLAGSCSVPTVMMNRMASVSDWRWLNGRSDSPWYPALSIVSQERLDDLDGVLVRGVAEVGRCLDAQASGGAGQQP